MYLSIGLPKIMTLEEPDDFKRFKVVIRASSSAWSEVADLLGGDVRLADAATAWVPEATLRRLGPQEVEWQGGVGRMIAGARKFGWIDDQTGDIKAHVEWLTP